MLRRMFNNARHFVIAFFCGQCPPGVANRGGGKVHASLIYMRAVRSIPAYRQKVKEHLGYVPFFSFYPQFPQTAHS